MGRINYSVSGRWEAVSQDQAARMMEQHKARYRARLLSNPAVRLMHDTRTLARLTERINEQTGAMRAEYQQRERAPEDAALEALRAEYGR